MGYVRSKTGEIASLRCDMKDTCVAQVTHIDEKGFVYCTEHGYERRVYSGKRCRQLKAAEMKKLLAGKPLVSY